MDTKAYRSPFFVILPDWNNRTLSRLVAMNGDEQEGNEWYMRRKQ